MSDFHQLTADVQFEGTVVQATLASDGVMTWRGETSSGSLRLLQDALGFRKGASSITLHSYQVQQGGCFTSHSRAKKDLYLDFSDASAHSDWCAALQQLFDDSGECLRIANMLFRIPKELQLSAYDGIVCVSGDGVVTEVLNGLLERSDWQEAVKTPVGHIPAGSGNALAKSLLDSAGEAYGAANAAFAIIRAAGVGVQQQGPSQFP
eukprot:jgi/Mesen1/3723/ME000202S02813